MIYVCTPKQVADDMRVILATLQSEGVRKSPLLVLLLKVINISHGDQQPGINLAGRYSLLIIPPHSLQCCT